MIPVVTSAIVVPSVVVSVHDIAPDTWPQCRAWLRALDRRSIPATLLVIPSSGGQPLDHRDNKLVVDALHDARSRGHDIAQHGLEHRAADGDRSFVHRRTGLVLARGCDEFWGLPYDTAKRWLELGRSRLEDLDLGPSGFVAPGLLLSSGARRAVADVGYRYTCTHRHIVDLTQDRSYRAIAISQRPNSRVASIGAVGVPAVARALRRLGRPLRLALHPADVDRAELVRSSLRVIDELRDNESRFFTYERFLDARGSA